MIARGLLITLFLAALMGVAGTVKAQSAGDYFADPKSRCKIWWPGKEHYTTMSVQWKGACSKGMAEGRGTFEVVEQFSIASISRLIHWSGEGDFSDGKLGGRGFMVSRGGTRLEGEFRDGVLNGRGITSTTSGTNKSREEADYRDGKKNGWGVSNSEETFEGRILIQHYEGGWRDNEYDGRGIFVRSQRGCAAEMRYEGEWKDGRMHGRGTVKLLNGKTFSGVFNEGRIGNLYEIQMIPLADDFKKAC